MVYITSALNGIKFHIILNGLTAMNMGVLRLLSYGMYIVTSKKDAAFNGQIANTVFQVCASPPIIAVCINKKNFTHEFIEKSKVFAVSILSKEAPMKLIWQFGFKCGRECNKFENVGYKIGMTGVPIILDSTIGYIEAKVTGSMDVGTHTLFAGKVIEGDLLSKEKPMSYAYYHEIKGGDSPEAAPTYIKNEVKKEVRKMEKYVCKICGYVYDPEKGDPDKGIAPGTSFQDLPNDWVCPVCGASKNQFERT